MCWVTPARFPIGPVSIGFLALGLLPMGAIALGLVASYGAISAAPIALGWASLGYYTAAIHSVGNRVWTPSTADGEMPRMVAQWFSIGHPAVIVTLSFISYLAPTMPRPWARRVSRADHSSRRLAAKPAREQ